MLSLNSYVADVLSADKNCCKEKEKDCKCQIKRKKRRILQHK